MGNCHISEHAHVPTRPCLIFSKLFTKAIDKEMSLDNIVTDDISMQQQRIMQTKVLNNQESRGFPSARCA